MATHFILASTNEKAWIELIKCFYARFLESNFHAQRHRNKCMSWWFLVYEDNLYDAGVLAAWNKALTGVRASQACRYLGDG